MDYQTKSVFKPVALLLAVALLVTGITVGLAHTAGGSGSSGNADAVSLSAVTADAEDADITFTFADSGITASGSAAGSCKIEDTTLTILKAGTYLITGSCSDGSVVVDKNVSGVTLILQDLDLTGASFAPIVCKKESTSEIYVSGTVNLTDGEDPSEESTSKTFEGAAIKVKSGAELTIGGDGTLNIDASGCKNGISGASQAAVTINGSLTLNITAANTGLASDGEVVIGSGTVNITAGNDGIKADPDDDDTESAGNITIVGGTVTVEAEDHGIMALNDLVIGTRDAEDGPAVTVTKSVEGLCGKAVYLYSGTGSVAATDDGVNAASGEKSSTENTIEIDGGDWTVSVGNGGGDGIDSNGTIEVNGGVTRIFIDSTSDGNAIDYGEQSNWTVNGGVIIGSDYNGSATVPATGTYVQFGKISMMGGMDGQGGGMSDGMNGGFDRNSGSESGDGAGMTPPDMSDQSESTGSSVTSTASTGTSTAQNGMGGRGGMGGMAPGGGGGFGQDGSSDGGDFGAMPDGGMNGGMMSGDESSGDSLGIFAGDTITITDESGNVIFETTALQNSTHLILAGGELVSGSSYTLLVNGTEAATATAEGN